MSAIKHSAKKPNWGTPPEVIKLVRGVFADIDLDPASTPEDNKIVGARGFYGPEQNGLVQTWYGRVFLNPPGGKMGRRCAQSVWWDTLYGKYRAGGVEAAIFVAFSIEFLQTSQNGLYDFTAANCICVPRSRIKFRGESQHPSHTNAILYLGPFGTLFEEVFSELGTVFFIP